MICFFLKDDLEGAGARCPLKAKRHHLHKVVATRFAGGLIVSRPTG